VRNYNGELPDTREAPPPPHNLRPPFFFYLVVTRQLRDRKAS